MFISYFWVPDYNSNWEKNRRFRCISLVWLRGQLKEILSVFYTAYMFFFSCEFKPGKIAVFDVFSKFSYELKPKEIFSVFYTAYMWFLT